MRLKVPQCQIHSLFKCSSHPQRQLRNDSTDASHLFLLKTLTIFSSPLLNSRWPQNPTLPKRKMRLFDLTCIFCTSDISVFSLFLFQVDPEESSLFFVPTLASSALDPILLCPALPSHPLSFTFPVPSFQSAPSYLCTNDHDCSALDKACWPDAPLSFCSFSHSRSRSLAASSTGSPISRPLVGWPSPHSDPSVCLWVPRLSSSHLRVVSAQKKKKKKEIWRLTTVFSGLGNYWWFF